MSQRTIFPLSPKPGQLSLFALDPKPANGEATKVCSRCQIEQPLSAFPSSLTYRQGVHHLCRGCAREHDGVVRTFRQNGGFELYLRLQGGHCALCETTKDLCTDVYHRTMKVRGILCLKCNVMLGQMEKTNAVVRYLLGLHLRGNGDGDDR